MKKYIFIYIIMSWVCLVPQAQNTDKNYIKVYKPNIEISNGFSLKTSNKESCQKSIEYFDGLGRPDQLIQVAASPNGYDMVQPIQYDQFGSEKKKYLPYTLSFANTGMYVVDEIDANKWNSHYGSVEKAFAFSDKVFDKSPLNRVLEQGAPGQIWQPGNGHTIQRLYSCNTSADQVIWFTVDDNILGNNGFYTESQLHKIITKDENWTSGKLHTTEEYKNKLGQVVLMRSYLNENTSLDTYYVYDNVELLRFVLPPEAIAQIYGDVQGPSDVVLVNNNCLINEPGQNVSKYLVEKGSSLTLSDGFTFSATSTNSLTITTGSIQSDLFYSYKYDGRKRMIEKKLPGAEPIYMVYDKRDRLIATQDGNQRKDNKWLVTKYNALDQVVMTGFYSCSKNQYGLQQEVNGFYANTANPMFESRGNALKSYDNKSFPKTISEADVLVVNYYDDYSNITHCPQTSYNTSQILNSDLLNTPKGQLTASWVKTLNASSGKPGGLWTVNFYDKKYQLVQSRSDNYLGGYDRITNVYDFAGKVDRSIHKHVVNSKTIVEYKWMTYDHAGRLSKVEQQYAGAVTKARTTIFQMVYDELGQLITKKLTGAGRNLDYQYNIRGWLTSMNGHKKSAVAGKGSDEFGFALNYNAGATSFGGQNQYNGNIGSMEWWSNGIQSLTNHQQAYGYTYDALNRVTNADFRENLSGWKNTASTYDVSGITYNLNGNILILNRYGAGAQIDQLIYGYNGNQLTYVNDGKSETEGFKEFSNTTSEYAYDANGNMKRDDNKKISLVAYNLLNLPESITRKDAGDHVRNVAYAYSATGEKLENRLPDNKLLQYCANFVYENGSLKYILNGEGKLEINGTGGTYKYFVKDHLGNTRLAVGEGESSVATELNHYYPFGLRMAMANSKADADQKYLYNGKEMQEETDWLDYGARMYDASLGRWNVVDPMAESYYSQSTYHFSGNNPILNFDSNGMNYGPVYNMEYQFLGFNEEGLMGDAYVMPQDQFYSGMSMFHSDLVGTAYSEMNRWEKWQFDGNALGHWNEMLYESTAMTYPAPNIKLAYLDAGIGMVSGGTEFLLGATTEVGTEGLTSALSIPMMVDGGARFLSSSAKMGFLLSGDYRNANAIPGNLGGWSGKFTDMAFGTSYYQNGIFMGLGSFTNDFISIAAGGGTGLARFVATPTAVNGFAFGTNVSSTVWSSVVNAQSMKQRKK